MIKLSKNGEPKKFVVVTSIQKFTDALRMYADFPDHHVVFVSDSKTPTLKSTENITVLSVNDQNGLGFTLSSDLPFNHYSRKNIGYLFARKEGAKFIIDTDDDNYPYRQWNFELKNYEARIVSSDNMFVNIYAWFTKEFIWPRGLFLSAIREYGKQVGTTRDVEHVSIWQGLVDQDADVDAIHRIVFGTTENFRFDQELPVILSQDTYSPFNSQNTLWKIEAFPLMYLPSFVTFRFTDILRGYIAQRCLWAMGKRIGFTSSSAYQVRNNHDLYEDFSQEIPSYLGVNTVVQTINAIRLSGDPLKDIVSCYVALLDANIVKNEEIEILLLWLKDCQSIVRNPSF